jgi:hypothetical protein
MNHAHERYVRERDSSHRAPVAAAVQSAAPLLFVPLKFNE